MTRARGDETGVEDACVQVVLRFRLLASGILVPPLHQMKWSLGHSIKKKRIKRFFFFTCGATNELSFFLIVEKFNERPQPKNDLTEQGPQNLDDGEEPKRNQQEKMGEPEASTLRSKCRVRVLSCSPPKS